MFINRNSKLLIIDDRDEDMLFILVSDMRRKFPQATIHYVTGFKGIEEKIAYGNYQVILLDRDLKDFGWHRTFGNDGTKIVSFIREFSPDTKIVGISNRPDSNELLLRAGADTCIAKEDILSFFSTEELLVA